jgi:hypothetical protein
MPVSAQTLSPVKVAFYNIQGGKGEPGFPGRSQPFVDTANCVDTTKPLNAWGVGFVQRTLTAKLGSDLRSSPLASPRRGSAQRRRTCDAR